MNLHTLLPDKYAQWDSFVYNHPDATFFHTTKWMNILQEYGFAEPVYLLIEDSEGIVGGLPLLSPPIFPFGKGLVSLPDCTGPLVKEVRSQKLTFINLLQKVEEEVKKKESFVLKDKASSIIFIKQIYAKFL